MDFLLIIYPPYQKISKAIGVISKSRFFLSSKSLLTLYHTLEYPYLSYWNILWSSTYPSNLNRMFLLYKCIVRIKRGAEHLAHIVPLFYNLNILDIYNINDFLVACFMYSYYNNLLPNAFDTLFSTHHQIHRYDTWNNRNYCTHYCRSNIKQFTIMHQGPKVWNSLPCDVILSYRFSISKTSLKKFLTDRKLN